MKRVLCVWLPNWPLQRLLAAQPELRNRPIVLYHTARLKTGGQGPRVLACSHQAAQRGVEAGISVADARGLLQGSQDSRELFLAEHDERADLRALERLAILCQRFSPTVGLAEPCSYAGRKVQYPDTLLLDVAGSAHLFRGEQHLADQVEREFRQQQLSVQIAIADTIGAAWAVAHFSPEQIRASGTGKPTVLSRIVPPEEQASYLQDLPIVALRLELETLQTLRELDLRTIGQLQALPRASLPSRLGNQVIRRLDQALGQVAEQVVPLKQTPPAEASHTFLQPICQQQILVLALQRLIEQLVDQLRPRQEGVQRLLVQLSGANREQVRFSVGLVGPCESPAYLAQMVQAHLQRQRMPHEVVEVYVRVTGTVSCSARQADLFNDSLDLAKQKPFRQLLDRLAARLGEQAVRRTYLFPDSQPEHAFRWQPLMEELPLKISPNHKLVLPPAFFSARPLWLKRRPLRIRVSVALTDGPPIRIGWNSRDYVVLRSWGPERIETGWWRADPIQRDYYRVETNCGQRFWLFRQISTGSWFLHGEFLIGMPTRRVSFDVALFAFRSLAG